MNLNVGERAQYTHAGRRRVNQDAVVVQLLDGGQALLAVADGMGGHLAGEIASARALEVLIGELQAGEGLREAMRAANAAVYAEAGLASERRGMGTTLVAVLGSDRSYEVGNVGDSRAYRIDARAIHQLTVDHSFAAEAVRAGSMSAAEVAGSPWRNALTRAVGTDPEIEIDLFGPFPLDEPHALFLCSDGLYKSVPDHIIREYVLSTEDLETAVHALAALAFRNGSDDNITVAAVEFGTLPRRPSAITLPVPIPRQASVNRFGPPRT